MVNWISRFPNDNNAKKLLEVRINNYLVDDEDVELINGAQAQLASMKQRYELLYGGV